MSKKLVLPLALFVTVTLIGCDVGEVISTVPDADATVIIKPVIKPCLGSNCAPITNNHSGDIYINSTINNRPETDSTPKVEETSQIQKTLPTETKQSITEFTASYDSNSPVFQIYDSKSEKELKNIVSMMAQYPNSELSITGYADQSESGTHQLGMDRAEGLKQVLTANSIHQNRINVSSEIGRNKLSHKNQKVVATLKI